MSKMPRRVLIVGAGLGGLVLAARLRDLPDTEIFLFEQRQTFDDDTFYVIQRFGIQALLDLGVGKRLGAISSPVHSFRSLQADTAEVLVDWTPTSDPEQASSLPPAIACRKSDLVRMLLTLLVRKDLVAGDFQFRAPTRGNSIESDIAEPGWYERELAPLLPNLYMGYELTGAQVSASHGRVLCKFGDDEEVECDILIGADGFHSTVRDIFLNSRYPPQHAGSCIIQGIVPKEAVSEIFKPLPDTAIPGIQYSKTNECLESGKSLSWFAQDVKIGITSLESGTLLWNLIASQQKPQEHVEVMLARRFVADIDPNTKDVSDAWMMPVSDPSPTSTEPLVAIPEDVRNAQDAQENRDAAPALQQAPLKVSQDLRLDETLQLAVSFFAKDSEFPSILGKLVGASDTTTLVIKDCVDLADEPPSSYITPNFHPGRVILVGDAAHACAPGPHGSVAAALTVVDATFLGDLFLAAFSDGKSRTKEEEASLLKNIAVSYDSGRRRVCENRMLQARQESKWKRREPGFLRSILQFGSKYSWTQLTFHQWISEGGLTDGDGALPKQV